MEKYSGKSVYGGIAIGRIRVCRKDERYVKRVSAAEVGEEASRDKTADANEEPSRDKTADVNEEPSRDKTVDVNEELSRYEAAKGATDFEIKALRDKTLKEVGEAAAAIFDGHRMILEDKGFDESVRNIILGGRGSAEYAIACTGDKYTRRFASMEDDYMRERAADVRDVSDRLLAALGSGWQGKAGKEADAAENTAEKEAGAAENAAGEDAPEIIVADDLAPSETVRLDRERVRSFVTVHGSPNSHTAILARAMGIPALAGAPLPLDGSVDGKLAVVDGDAGIIYIDPDEAFVGEMRRRQQKEHRRKESLLALRDKETVTLDGHKLMLCANIGNMEDLERAVKNGADGVGLFRSEFIYLERNTFPTEEEQFLIYRRVTEAMAGKRVVIRTLDVGADKQCGYFPMEKEENPALGCRGIRICLAQPEIFKTQLRAIFRASAFGRVAVMYPMIANMEEIKRIQAIVTEVKAELDARGEAYGKPEQGIMIETPAAALISDKLAKEVDFFSIGTNDLTQYALAVDRQNSRLSEFYDPHHPAVLRMTALTVENAHRAGIWAGICGELGADETLTGEFLAMGVDELSVPPEYILPIRKLVRETDMSRA